MDQMISAGAQLFQVLRPDQALPSEISRLHVKLSMSRILVERCECWRYKFKIIDDLLPQIKDLEYESQTLLNEFTYQELKERVEGPNRSFAGELISSSLTNFKNWWSGYTNKVKEVHEKLDYVYVALKEACDVHGVPENHNQFSKTARPETSSLITEPKVFGRDKELDEVIRLLGVPSVTEDGSSSRKRAKKDNGLNLSMNTGVKSKENVCVLPIVGIGGVGKTTLAQIICNNKTVKSHFELIIWVCVSDNFDVARLTKEMIECATKKVCDINNLDTLQVTVREMLESTRFLLVLDDVWSESKMDWHRLFRPIKEGCEGSMVIVTTRSQKVAEITGTVMTGPIILEGLEPDVYWKFFRSCAFGITANSEKYSELEDIGKQIVVKLKGSPLAAKTLGGLLNTDLDERHWMNIRDSEMWELQQEEHGILPVLQLSYQYLPSHLKKCFSFCSLYPKDYRIRESGLTQFWISEGFIAPQQKNAIHVIAKGYIRDLVSRCFLLEAGNSDFECVYVIHDLMHDVSQSVTKDECFRIENEYFEQKVSRDIRHMSIIRGNLKVNKQTNLCRYNKLHSLRIHRNSKLYCKAIESWCNELTNICSLSLANSNIEKLPENIGNLRHLRYLDISCTKVVCLPNSLCNLYSLEVLNMLGCRYIQCFPQATTRLISMKLFLWDSPKLVGHIPNLAKAMQFKNLKYFVNNENGSTLEKLKLINGIYGEISIFKLENVSSKEEAENAQLNNKEFVETLCLNWSFSVSTDSICYDEQHEEVFEGLCPHPNLKILKVDCYGGENLHASWLEGENLTNLKKVEINCCKNLTIAGLPRSITELVIMDCERLTSLENCLVPSNLPAVKIINIWQCGELVLMPVETFDGFISLEQLIVKDCPKLACPNKMVLPPSVQKLQLRSCGNLAESVLGCLNNVTSLTRLTIEDCPKLRCPRTISLPPSLHYLDMDASGAELKKSFSSCLQNLTLLTELKIENCPKLDCPRNMALPPSLKNLCFESCGGELEKWFSSSLRNLTSLAKLTMSNCPGVTSIPVHVASKLKSLVYLEVLNCDKLRALGGQQFLASIETICIKGCPKLKEIKGKDSYRARR